MQTTIIGIDCATVPSRVGLARGILKGRVLLLKQAGVTGGMEEMVDQLVAWIGGKQRVLVTFDAPLGWPEPLGRHLAIHRAGEPVLVSSNRLFRRETDRFVRERHGKLPLDVGADRIARTAHAALVLLTALRERTGEPIPLVWNADYSERVGAIEVYPAGTLSAAGVRSSGYKEQVKVAERQTIIDWLATQMVGVSGHYLLLDNADVLDATICLVAGKDFLLGEVLAPTSVVLAKKEGWIWVRSKPNS